MTCVMIPVVIHLWKRRLLAESLAHDRMEDLHNLPENRIGVFWVEVRFCRSNTVEVLLRDLIEQVTAGHVFSRDWFSGHSARTTEG